MRHMAFFMLYRNYTKRQWICRRVSSLSVGFSSGHGLVRTFSCIVELNLILCDRLVSIPLLQHNMGRRDIFPLREPRVCRKLLGHTWRRR